MFLSMFTKSCAWRWHTCLTAANMLCTYLAKVSPWWHVFLLLLTHKIFVRRWHIWLLLIMSPHKGAYILEGDIFDCCWLCHLTKEPTCLKVTCLTAADYVTSQRSLHTWRWHVWLLLIMSPHKGAYILEGDMFYCCWSWSNVTPSHNTLYCGGVDAELQYILL